MAQAEARAAAADERAAWAERRAVLWDPGDDADGASLATARGVEAAVRRHVPAGETVLVASGGEEIGVELEDHEARVFPPGGPAADDQPPVTDAEAIDALERQRQEGVGYLVLPVTALPWLERHKEFGRHLGRYPSRQDNPGAAVIFDLSQPADAEAEEERIA